MMKHFYLMSLILVLSLTTGACSVHSISPYSEERISQELAKGKKIVEAVERYKELNNKLPDSLKELIDLELLEPSTIGSAAYGRMAFEYHRRWTAVGGKWKYRVAPSLSGCRCRRWLPVGKWKYRVELILNRPTIYLFGTDSITSLIFLSDGKYEGKPKGEIPGYYHEVQRYIDGWAIRTTHYGSNEK